MLRVCFPATITSPIAPLAQWVHVSIANVAPERTNELNRLLAGYTLELLDDPSWICSATFATSTIRISTGVIETLWAQAYAAAVFHNEEVADKTFDGSVVQVTNPTTLEALALYRWALHRMIYETGAAWPASLPQPRTDLALDPTPADENAIARELTLVATGFVLLHEIAHLSLQHTPNSASEWSIDEERDADAWAADWLLTGGDLPLPQLDKRARGIALTFLAMLARGIHTGNMNGVTHPRAFDRLYNALAHRIPPELDGVWMLIVEILSLHLTATALVPPNPRPFDTAREAANAIVDHLAELHERKR